MARQYLIIISLLTIVFIGFQNCSEVDFANTDLSRLVDPADAVCDPFSNTDNTEVTAQNGLVGQLRYLVMGVHGDSRSELNSRDLDYYANEAVPADGVLFFSQVNTPTMSFDQGFRNGAGQILQNPVTMDDLVEWFSMHFETRLVLGMADSEAEYQLAILSDDGSSLYIDDNGNWQQMINNDGTHPARLICASETISMTYDSEVPIRLNYFQGPRTEIAFQVLWREVPPGGDLSDPLCGVTGSSTFFTGYQNGGTSVPTQAYMDFMDRGWKVLEPQNYRLPVTVQSNPCVDQ